MNSETDTQALSLPNPTKSWPGAFGVYKLSREAVMVNVWTNVGLYLILTAFDLLLSVLLHNGVLRLVGYLINWLLGSWWVAANIHVWLAGARHQKMSLDEAVSLGAPMILMMFLLYLMIVVTMVLSLLLFIIPFFFIFPRIYLAPYYLVDEKMNPLEAYKSSWHNTKGNVGKVYGVLGVTILIILLALTFIGIPFSIYFIFMYSGAYSILYLYIKQANRQTVAPDVESQSAIDSIKPSRSV